MTPAGSRGLRKATRDLFQSVLAVVAGGGSYALLEVIVGSVSPVWGVMLAFAFKVLVAYAQNYLETCGKIPAMLPSPGLVTTEPGGLTGKVVATVDTALEAPGKVAGPVLGAAGNVLGAVAGTLTR